MITLQYSDLTNQHLLQELSKFGETSFTSVKDSYRLMRVMKKFESELKHANDLQNKLLKDYAKKDEKGNFVFVKDDAGKPTGRVELIEDKIPEYQKKFAELNELSFDINALKLSEQAIMDAKLSPSQLITLEKFIEINDDEKLEVVQ